MKWKTFFFIPLFFLLSLKANYTITKRALPKMKGERIVKALSFIIYYILGLPFCMNEYMKQAKEQWQETEDKTGDGSDI